MLNLIVAIDETYGISKHGQIPWNIPIDRRTFARITKDNPVVMGYNTWLSLPNRPLKGRVNVVFSRNHTIDDDDVIVVKNKEEFFKLSLPNAFIIGGKQIYDLFIDYIDFSYVSVIHGDFKCDVKFDRIVEIRKELVERKLFEDENHVGMTIEIWRSKLPPISLNMIGLGKEIGEQPYINLIKTILKKGVFRNDRTGTGTISVFSPEDVRFDLENDIVPLITTKYVPYKTVIKELLWFIKGQTDAKILQRENVHIWDKNSSESFLKDHGLEYEEGVLGPVYGWQWRRSGAEYDPRYADSNDIVSGGGKHKGFDQISYVIDQIRTNPTSRRIIIDSWAPNQLDQMALPPCHMFAQFYVTGDKKLSCKLYMRSSDVFLGLPFNIFSYSVLTKMIANECKLPARELIVSFGDAHLYTDHIEQAKTLINRIPYPFPLLIIEKKPFFDLEMNDFKFFNYYHHPKIVAKMSA